MTGPDLRASDADRQRVTAALQRHTAAGRLTLDEYAERVDRALTARTHAELADVTRDLPAEPPAPVPDGSGGHQLGVAFLLSLLALAVLAVLVVIGR